MYRGKTDPKSFLIMEDILEILYILNRMRNNSYDYDYVKNVNKMSEMDRLEDFIKLLFSNKDKKTKESAKKLMSLIQDIDSVKYGINNLHHNEYKEREELYLKPKFKENLYTEGDDGLFNKLIFFLKSLNDEE